MSITILCIGLIESNVDATEPSHRKGRLVPYEKNGNVVERVVVDRGVPYLCIYVDYLSLKHICVFVCLSTDSIYRLAVPVCLLNTKMFAHEIF